MRPRYSTRALVLGRSPVGEASASVALLTEEFGLVRARAQGVRKPGAKLAGALQTFAENEVILVRGKDGWRLSGALLSRRLATELTEHARLRAGRIASLSLRLIHGETRDADLFGILHGLIVSLPDLTEEEGEAAECLAALRLLAALGLDAGDIPGAPHEYDASALSAVVADRASYIARVNRGIAASGL